MVYTTQEWFKSMVYNHKRMVKNQWATTTQNGQGCFKCKFHFIESRFVRVSSHVAHSANQITPFLQKK
jgi:hypothetical protein